MLKSAPVANADVNDAILAVGERIREMPSASSNHRSNVADADVKIGEVGRCDLSHQVSEIVALGSAKIDPSPR
jgi:hypothetical protein